MQGMDPMLGARIGDAVVSDSSAGDLAKADVLADQRLARIRCAEDSARYSR
jgi:hypothetical protein